MHKYLKSSFLIIITLSYTLAVGQNSMVYTDEDLNYKTGFELFEKQKYALAQDYFQKVIDYYGNEHTDVKADAEYFSALCAIELFNADAEYRIANFIAKYPESPRTRMAYFEMGKHQYRNNDYEQTVLYLNKVWKQYLNKDQLSEYYFKLAYSYFKLNNLDRAAKAFYEVIDKDSKYKGPALYYYSHVAYLNGNYETALNGFSKLKDDPTFSPVVPYYIIQIYYLQGKSDKVLEVGPGLLNSTKSKREGEISRLIGEALYSNKNYQEALPYLEKYKEKSDVYTREDIYQLAYAYYMTNANENAVATWSNITNVQDNLTQNAFFHMADCYLRLNEKEKARLAFNEASKLEFDSDIKEISMLNYAKLSYELSYSPFNETLTAFYTYLSTYPTSTHRDEAYGYLAKVYLTSKNYREALASLNKIQIKSPEMLTAYQRVSFFRGLELLNNLELEASLSAFELSLNTKNFDAQIHSLAFYWKAEALYRLNKYEKAAETYQDFLHSPGAYLLSEYNLTYYNLGYSYFKLKDYNNAISWFRKFTDKGTEVDTLKLTDAFIRIGDCYFVTSRYAQAVDYYDNAIKVDSFDVDYAMFQKGFSYGLLKRYSEKALTLSTLLQNNPNSEYAADAIYERGRSYVAIDSVNLAIVDFEMLLSSHSNSSYIPKALLQLGLMYYSNGNNDKALFAYKQVVEKYNGSTESKDALIGIKNIYVDINKVDDYYAYIKNQGGEENINLSEKDSLTYLAAERVYMSMQWESASQLLSNYLNDQHNGKFNTNAHYYRGDCYLRMGLLDSALNDFTFVVNKPKNLFTEQALLNAADLNYKQKDYKIAADQYLKLENLAEVKANLLIARIGQMQSAFNDSNYNVAIDAARKVLITEKVQEEDVRAARLVLAKSYEQTQMLDLSITQYRILALDIKNIEGAESKFKVCELLVKQNNLKDAESEVIEFISAGTPHQYWLAKAFLLLSDIYVLSDDRFQAKANLKSLMRNYTITTDGIIKEAEKRYDEIVTQENRQFKKEKSKAESDNINNEKESKENNLAE